MEEHPRQPAANPLVRELDGQLEEMEKRANSLQKLVDRGEEMAEMMRTAGYQRVQQEHKNAVKAFQRAALILDFDEPKHRHTQQRLKERSAFFQDCKAIVAHGKRAARDLTKLQKDIDAARKFVRRHHA